MPVKAVLLDLVGTVLDEATDYAALDAAMKLVIERFQLDARPKDLSGEFSLALMEILRTEDDITVPTPFIPFEKAAKDIFAAVLEFRGFKASPEDVAWFWSSYLAAQRKHWKLHADAKPVLKLLKEKGWHVGLITDADRYMVTEILPALRLDGLIDSVTTAEEAGFPKPHPDIFLLAMQKADVKADETVIVGDSYERDILGAKAAGIERAILVDRHRARTVSVPTLPNLKRVPRLVEQMKEGAVFMPPPD